jgi:hypothetical protein
MKLRLLKIFALIGVVLFVAALWPVFTQAETSLAAGFVIVSAAGIGIAALALFSNKRWLLWAALGVWPGALTGGLLFAVISLADDHGRYNRLSRSDRRSDRDSWRFHRRHHRSDHRWRARLAQDTPGEFNRLIFGLTAGF